MLKLFLAFLFLAAAVSVCSGSQPDGNDGIDAPLGSSTSSGGVSYTAASPSPAASSGWLRRMMTSIHGLLCSGLGCDKLNKEAQTMYSLHGQALSEQERLHKTAELLRSETVRLETLPVLCGLGVALLAVLLCVLAWASATNEGRDKDEIERLYRKEDINERARIEYMWSLRQALQKDLQRGAEAVERLEAGPQSVW
eukprot:m51a1_g13740 hypothetical protein (197) ;mRNA; f:169200-169851